MDRRILILNSKGYIRLPRSFELINKKNKNKKKTTKQKKTDELRPIAPSYLNTLLELMLNLLVSLSMQHRSAPVETLSAALVDGHEISRGISTQIMSWFGEIKDGKWKMDVNAVVREVGLGVLRNHRVLFHVSSYDMNNDAFF